MVTFDFISPAFWNPLSLHWLMLTRRVTYCLILGFFTFSCVLLPFRDFLQDNKLLLKLLMVITSSRRREWWCDILDIRSYTTVPWMAIGDFNTILGAHELMVVCQLEHLVRISAILLSFMIFLISPLLVLIVPGLEVELFMVIWRGILIHLYVTHVC